MKISRSDIDKIVDSVGIVEVVSPNVELSQKGASLVGLCPFHNERNPSFKVSPSRNIYKCFSCGEAGGPVNFLMKYKGLSYVDALKEMAAIGNISINVTDDKPTAEEREYESKRTLALNIVNAAHKFFVEQLHSGNESANFALTYARGRWGEEFVNEEMLGFSPGRCALLSWAKKNGFSPELLIELGLLNKDSTTGKLRDGFFDRLIMPIRSRSNNVIGFIGRALSDNGPKYINSPDSIIFKKSEIIFGFSRAIKQGIKEGLFYLVEGCPDVYRLQIIGAQNVIAPMGLSWQRGQFDLLARYNASVCFIPDIDPPKDGEAYGPGIIGVMKAGRTALEAGLKVMVKEIHPKDAKEKADADSYITTKKILDGIQKEDFIVWYAKKIAIGADTTAERTDAMKEISALLALIRDKDYQKILIKQLSRKLGVTSSILQGAINGTIKRNAERKQLSGERMIDQELYSRYGFYEKNHCYFSLNKDGIEVRWSNFSMIPLFHIKDIINSKRLYKITNFSGRSEIIELKQEDLVSVQRFKVRVSSLGNYIWEAKDEQLTKLTCFLYEKTDTAVEITQLGWQRDGFFAFGNGIAYNNEWHPVDDFGIVRLKDIGNYYLPSASLIFKNERRLFQFERRFIHSKLSEISFKSYTEKLIQVFGDNAKVGICFLLAALFKDVVVQKTKNFPILNLFGPRGSGKSELGCSLMAFFIINNDPINLSTATDDALAEAVAQSSNALVHIDEYKNNIELSRREFLKSLYDGVGRNRMNMDRDKKRETTAVDCGVILSGQEMPTIDIALFHRVIYLTFDESAFSPAQIRQFNEMKMMRDMGCSHLTLELLRHRKRVEMEFSSNYDTAFRDIQEILADENIETRIFRDWVTILAIFRTFSGIIDVSFDYRNMLNICVKGIEKQNSVCQSTNELAHFWQMVDYLHQNGEIFIDSDYKIKFENTFKGKESKERTIFQYPKAVLYLCPKRVMMLYRKSGKVIGETTLPVESLRHYLEISKEYLGTKKAVRFKNVSNVMESTASATDSLGRATAVQTSRVDWALCFDYEKLVEKYEINLEIETTHEGDIDPIDVDENDQTKPY